MATQSYDIFETNYGALKELLMRRGAELQFWNYQPAGLSIGISVAQ
jgi:hypothetical protein